MSTDDDKIAPTAHYTAYVWHRLGMPHAELFATPLGAALFWGFRVAGEGALPRLAPGVPSMQRYLELRHRGIERAVEAIAPDRIIELGAGLSRRGVTFASRGIAYVEVDLPAMTALKQRLIEARASAALKAQIASKLTQLAADVLDERFERELASLVRGAERPVVIAEGLLGYFARPDRERLVRSIARALDGRGALVCELRTAPADAAVAGAVRVLKGGIRLVTRGRGTREDFADHDDVRRFFLDAGFAEAKPLAPLEPSIRTPARVWRAATHPDRRLA